jgi:hypothetical protein
MNASTEAGAQGAKRWLLLIHQLPPKPDYVRVKVRRRLQKLGAALLKNSVYVLPWSEESLEDFEWLAKEIDADGGEATICAATFVSGVSDADVERLLASARAPGTEVRGGAAAAVEGSTWVTRRDVFIDRMASAWLIRRFIDTRATFKFVANDYRPRDGELRFDMYRGEYTHVADRCTFETLLVEFGLDDSGLVAIGEIVHDLDLKDDKFGRPEAAGIGAVIRGIALSTTDDAQRLERGAPVFDGLYDLMRTSG